MTEFNINRTFGVEIEFLDDGRGIAHKVASLARQRGVDMAVEGYNHLTRVHWKIVTDASCGLEVVSPILKGREGLEELRKVCEVMNECGCKVNKKCGLHVHHDASNLTVTHFKRLFALYIRFEKTIDSMMPESRRANNNNYCKSLVFIQSLERIKNAKSLEQLSEVFSWNRYYKLNLQSYFRHGTIEFRQHSGTIEFEKMSNWVILTNIMITKAVESQVKMVYKPEDDTYASFKKALNMIKCKGASDEVVEVAKFYEKRIKSLNKGATN